MGTPRGIFAVEETPGALAAADVFWNGVDEGIQLQQWNSTKLPSTDSEVIEAVLQPQLGGSFIQRECEKECRDSLLSGPKPVYFFEWDWERRVASVSGAQALPTCWADEPDDRPEDDGLSSDQLVDLLAGGGFGVGKAT
jgi:hypothetical protein